MAVGSSQPGRAGRTATTTHAIAPTTAATAAGNGWTGGGSVRYALSRMTGTQTRLLAIRTGPFTGRVWTARPCAVDPRPDGPGARRGRPAR